MGSAWWPMQVDGTASAPLCLQAYGTPYAKLLEGHCGQHRKEHQRCVRSRKLDPLNMASWYPVCGEPFEMENACAGALIAELDTRCRQPLDRAASALAAAKGDYSDAKLRSSLEVRVSFDAAAARERFAASKRLMLSTDIRNAVDPAMPQRP